MSDPTAEAKPGWNAPRTTPAAPDEIECQLLELHAISVRHIARRLRLFPEEPVPPLVR